MRFTGRGGRKATGKLRYVTSVKNLLQIHKGAIPATIAILGGVIKAGLNQTEINKLGDVNSSLPIKTSGRDLAYVVSRKLNGGTTVAGTIIVAHRAGIPIFATGGKYTIFVTLKLRKK